jgi:hypothetical protein
VGKLAIEMHLKRNKVELFMELCAQLVKNWALRERIFQPPSKREKTVRKPNPLNGAMVFVVRKAWPQKPSCQIVQHKVEQALVHGVANNNLFGLAFHVLVGLNCGPVEGEARVGVYAKGFHGDVIGPEVALFAHPNINAELLGNAAGCLVVPTGVAVTHYAIDVLFCDELAQKTFPLGRVFAVVHKVTPIEKQKIAAVEVDFPNMGPLLAQGLSEPKKERPRRPLKEKNSAFQNNAPQTDSKMNFACRVRR